MFVIAELTCPWIAIAICRAAVADELEATVNLIEQSGSECTDERHNQQHAGHASTLRIEFLLLCPERAGAHTYAGH